LGRVEPGQLRCAQARVLREAARLAYHGDPPPAMAGWLAELGLEEAS